MPPRTKEEDTKAEAEPEQAAPPGPTETGDTDRRTEGPVDAPIGTHLGAIHHTPLNDVGQGALNAHAASVKRPEEGDPGPIDLQTEPAGDGFVRVTEDCVQEFYPPGAKRPSQRLIVAKGALLTEAQVAAVSAAS